MDSSSSESSGQCDEVQGIDEIGSDFRGSELEEANEPLGKAVGPVKVSPRLASMLPEGDMDEIKIQLAAAVIAGTTENQSQSIRDLRDAIKKK